MKPVEAYKFCCNVYESCQNLLCSIAKVNEHVALFLSLFIFDIPRFKVGEDYHLSSKNGHSKMKMHSYLGNLEKYAFLIDVCWLSRTQFCLSNEDG